MLAASLYAAGNPTRDPDILLYHLCKTLACLPSDIEREDATMMDKFILIDNIVNTELSNRAKRHA